MMRKNYPLILICISLLLTMSAEGVAGEVFSPGGSQTKDDAWRLIRTTHGIFPASPAPGVGWAYDKDGNLIFPEVDDQGRIIEKSVRLTSGEMPRNAPLGPIKITEYTSGTNPDTLEADSKGNIWFTMWGDQIGVHYASNDTVKIFDAPFSGTPDGIAVDENDDVWFGLYTSNELGVFHTSTGTWEKFKPGFGSSVAIPRADLKRGTIWYTDHPGNLIGEFNKTTKTFTQHPIPTPNVWAVDPEIDNDGNVWFTAWKDDSIMMLDRATGNFKTFPTPNKPSGPAFCQFDPSKENLYFSEWNGDRVGRLEIATGTITEWQTGPGQTSGMGYDPNGYIWYALNTANKIGILFPNNGTYIEQVVPTSAGMKDGGYVDHKNPGVFWFTETQASKIGKAEYAGGGSVISRIEVTPAHADITADQVQQFTATAYDQSNNRVNTTFQWGTSGGSIDSTGLYTPKTVGQFKVYANASGKSGSATINVTHGALFEVKVSPQNPSITADQTQRFTAEGVDTRGNRWPISPVWSVIGSGSIDPTGLYTPDKAGQHRIKATDSPSGKEGITDVIVTPGSVASVSISPATAVITADQTQQFTANALDSKGNTVPVTFTWSATGGSITQQGLYTPDKVGTWNVIASAQGKSGTASVEVKPGVLDRLVITPENVSITADDVQQFEVEGFDSRGNHVDVSPEWIVDGGSIDASGLYTPEKAGTWTVTVKDGSIRASTKVTVTPGRLALLILEPKSVTIEKKEKVTFTLRLEDAKRNTVTPDSVTWKYEGDDIGTFDEQTLTFTSRDAGEGDLKVTVKSGGVTKSDSAHIFVRGGLLDLKGGGHLITILLVVVIAVVSVIVIVSVLRRRRRRQYTYPQWGPGIDAYNQQYLQGAPQNEQYQYPPY